MDPETSSWSAIAYKYSDLCTFGQGGDSRINTRTQDSQMQDSDDVRHTALSAACTTVLMSIFFPDPSHPCYGHWDLAYRRWRCLGLP